MKNFHRCPDHIAIFFSPLLAGLLSALLLFPILAFSSASICFLIEVSINSFVEPHFVPLIDCSLGTTFAKVPTYSGMIIKRKVVNCQGSDTRFGKSALDIGRGERTWKDIPTNPAIL